MRVAVRIALAAGLALLIGLILREGSAILVPLVRAGRVLLWLVPLHALPLLLDSLGWRVLIARWRESRIASLFWIASVREGINRLLPAANIGGEIVGIRLLCETGVDGVAAAASVTTEVVLTIVSQYVFVMLGVLCLLRLTNTVQFADDVLIGLAASLPLLVLLALLLRYGSIFQRMERIAVRFLGEQTLSFLAGQSASLDAAIRELCTDAPRLLTAMAWQVTGMVAGSLETWLALRWLGHPVPFGAAIALESLTMTVRNFAFLVPAGLGVQEASLIGFGALLGVNGELALALSLAKRMREILFGVPALLSWYWVEGRRELQHVRGPGKY
ncbi:MAG TPA: lysylphosphatidylglycerol synthase domain-containing protein [Steroidobacteraceae bacterium]|jgi:putative membrane protein|nr:lysylphosphatidylglycerol synthase domain-containing protein [Steroidobacteraceae bacterium]